MGSIQVGGVQKRPTQRQGQLNRTCQDGKEGDRNGTWRLGLGHQYIIYRHWLNNPAYNEGLWNVPWDTTDKIELKSWSMGSSCMLSFSRWPNITRTATKGGWQRQVFLGGVRHTHQSADSTGTRGISTQMAFRLQFFWSTSIFKK